MKSGIIQRLAAAAAFIFLTVIFTRGLPGMAQKPPAEAATPAATSPEAKMTHENGQEVIHLSRQTQTRLGIAESPLKAARERKQKTLPAMVLPVKKLQSLVAAYDTAVARLQKAQITASVSQREYKRLKKLYSEDQNASAKALQAAAGAYSGDEVDVHLARQNLSLAAGAIQQSWGEAITGWLAHNRNKLGKVLRRNSVLIEMTVPADESISAPPSIEFNLPAGGRAFARFVSAYPQVDPRIQGTGYLYVTRARPGLAPGFNLATHFGVGALSSGVIIPSSAIVWWHGKAWAYVATAPGRFVRHEVSTDIRAPGGWFVTQGFAPGASVVTRDAQQVLGVELMPTPSSHPVAGEGDED